MRKRMTTVVVCRIILCLGLLSLMACSQMPMAPKTSENVSALSRIVDKGTLVLGTSADMPPMSMETKDKQVIGYDVDLAGMIAEAMGVKLIVKVIPFSELLPSLHSGQVDIVLSAMTITPQRNLKVAFAGPYMVSGKCILTKEETLADVDEPSDMNRAGLKLGALKSSTSETFVKTRIPDAKLVVFNDLNTAVSAVLNSSADALIADYPVCVVSMLRYPNQELISVLSLLTQEPLGVALPVDPLFINWMDNFLQNKNATGQLAELKSKWFENDSWLKELPRVQGK